MRFFFSMLITRTQARDKIRNYSQNCRTSFTVDIYIYIYMQGKALHFWLKNTFLNNFLTSHHANCTNKNFFYDFTWVGCFITIHLLADLHRVFFTHFFTNFYLPVAGTCDCNTDHFDLFSLFYHPFIPSQWIF